VTIASIAALLPAKTRIVRVMPNTPALVGAGASGYALGPTATAQDGDTVKRLYSATGVGPCALS
jgi:pyrroline-5-carboxylate reductase